MAVNWNARNSCSMMLIPWSSSIHIIMRELTDHVIAKATDYSAEGILKCSQSFDFIKLKTANYCLKDSAGNWTFLYFNDIRIWHSLWGCRGQHFKKFHKYIHHYSGHSCLLPYLSNQQASAVSEWITLVM